MLVADLHRDFVNTSFTPLADASFRRSKISTPRWSGAGEAVEQAQVAVAAVAVQRAADMRYVGQEHAVTSSCDRAVSHAGSRGHQARSTPCTRPLRLFSRPARRPNREPLRARPRPDAQARFEPIVAGAPSRRNLLCAANGRSISPSGRRVDTPTMIARSSSPAIASPGRAIEEYASTTVVHPGDLPHGRRLRRPVIEILAELSMDAS